VGAYTIVMTPPFINLAPAIVTVDSDGSTRLSRKQQTVFSFLDGYII
jgi:hypothetical protein